MTLYALFRLLVTFHWVLSDMRWSGHLVRQEDHVPIRKACRKPTEGNKSRRRREMKRITVKNAKDVSLRGSNKGYKQHGKICTCSNPENS